MNRRLEELALRKQVLQARSTLHRLEIQSEVQSIGGSLSWVGTSVKTATPWSIGTSLAGLALRSIASGRVGRVLALTSGLLLLVKLTRIGIRLIGETGAADDVPIPSAGEG